jgi:hypothetical protein
MQRVIRVLTVAALEGWRSGASGEGERAHQLRPLLPGGLRGRRPGKHGDRQEQVAGQELGTEVVQGPGPPPRSEQGP